LLAATTVVVAATAVVIAVTAIATAAEQEDDNKDPCAVSTKTVHKRTSF